MSMAFLSAKRSKDPVKQTGACIVNESNRIVGIGYNGFPRNIPNDSLSWEDGPEDDINSKHMYVCHAAMNAILNKNQEDLSRTRIYTTHFPCNECAKIITQSGIKKVIYAHPSLNDCVKSEATKKLFALLGVALIQFTSKRDPIELNLAII